MHAPFSDALKDIATRSDVLLPETFAHQKETMFTTERRQRPAEVNKELFGGYINKNSGGLLSRSSCNNRSLLSSTLTRVGLYGMRIVPFPELSVRTKKNVAKQTGLSDLEHL